MFQTACSCSLGRGIIMKTYDSNWTLIPGLEIYWYTGVAFNFFQSSSPKWPFTSPKNSSQPWVHWTSCCFHIFPCLTQQACIGYNPSVQMTLMTANRWQPMKSKANQMFYLLVLWSPAKDQRKVRKKRKKKYIRPKWARRLRLFSVIVCHQVNVDLWWPFPEFST